MGGCGKSQLALDYCQRAQAGGRYNAIFWIDASSPDTVVQSYTIIAKAISEVKLETTDSQVIIRVVRDIVGAWTRPWLLVFDNFDDPKAFYEKPIQNYLPQGGKGFVIFTSRHADAGRLGYTIKISDMSEQEALELLFRSSHRERHQNNVAEGKKIVRRLGCLPLAVDQAGAYIRERIEFDSFLYHFDARQAEVLRRIPAVWEYRRKGNDTETEQLLSVATTWELSFDQIAGSSGDNNDVESKRHFLTLSAFFNSQNISEDLFRICNESTAPAWIDLFVREGIWDKYKFLDVIAELRNLSLIRDVEEGIYGMSFSLHPLIKDWIKLRLSPQDCQNYVTEAMLILFEYLNTRNSDRLTLHAKQAVLSHLDAALDNYHLYFVRGVRLGESVSENLFLTFAKFYRDQGRYKEAEGLYEQALEGKEEQLGQEYPDTLDIAQNLAIVYAAQGRYNEAKRLYERTLKGREEQLGPEHPDTLRTVQNLANIYVNQGQYEEAKQLYERVLQGRKKQLGSEHPDTLGTVQNLANVCADQGQYEAAEKLYEWALEGREKQLGPRHLDTLGIVQNLAIVYTNQGRYVEAEQLYERVLEGNEEQLGREHPDMLRTVQNLAIVYATQGRYNEAEQLYERALKERERQLGPEHPDTLHTIQNLAIVYTNQDRYNEAERLYERALKGNEERLGREHPDTLRTVQNLAIVYAAQGQDNKAECLYARALEGREAKLGPEHPDTLRTVQNLANVYITQGRYEEAEQMYERVLKGNEKQLGLEHPDTLRTMQNLSIVYTNQGRYHEVERLNMRLLQTREEQMGLELPGTLRTVQSLSIS
jgi:tetratricopeptide (TPR) repeat protein